MAPEDSLAGGDLREIGLCEMETREAERFLEYLAATDGGAGSGCGGKPREYAALYSQASDNLVHLPHGRVPVQRVFFSLQLSQALVIF